jgi:dolichol-phosphate mannosyltransferase
MPLLSIVIPVYGCDSCLIALYERLTTVLQQAQPDYELVFVDDRSRDNGWRTLTELASRDPLVNAVRLSRNFGQHAAITAGLQYCRGKHAIVMDCDLQDPPEAIPRLITEANKGLDIVYGRRTEKKQSLFRRVAARAFFWFLNRFADAPVQDNYGTLSIISRRVIDVFLQLNDRNRQYILILKWLGFSSGEIEYVHGSRYAGESSYTLLKLFNQAFVGILFQTTAFLKWIIFFGFGMAVTGVAVAGYFTYQYFVHAPLPGWTSLVVLILLTSGFVIMSTGVAGLYIGKIFEQVNGRPLYAVDEIVGFQPS